MKTKINFMWQRIQTLYLAISTVLVAALFFSVKAAAYGADGLPTKEIGYIEYIPYLILLILITLLNLLALTTFKIRVFQMRTAVLSALLTLALQIWLAVDFFTTKDVMVFKLTAVFPIIAVILDVMAARGILADQLLVESAYRLRKSRRERRK
jgi:hypothetical protein